MLLVRVESNIGDMVGDMMYLLQKHSHHCEIKIASSAANA